MRLIRHREDFTKNQAKAYIKDGGIRQNSTYFILRYILLLRKAINKYLLAQRKPANDSYDLSQDALTNKDQQQVEQLVKILKPFILATKRIEGDANSPSIKGLYSTLQDLITNIKLLY